MAMALAVSLGACEERATEPTLVSELAVDLALSKDVAR